MKPRADGEKEVCMDFTQKTVLLWDLDGTLTDPADGIVHSV